MRQIYSPLDGFRSPFGRLMGSTAPFTPSALFALAEPGVWYDPSDLTTLFQDTAGTLPVTTPGQTVALALDKSKGLVLGSELVSNPGPFANTTGWSVTGGSGGTISVVSDDLQVASTGAGVLASSAISTVVGRTYSFFVRARNGTYSGATVGVATTATATPSPLVTLTSSVDSVYRFLFVATQTTTYINIRFPTVDAGTAFFDNISVKELPGFHATQATLASRPTYGIVPLGGRRNLLERTEEFGNATHLKSAVTVTDNAAVDPLGNTTADKLIETATNATHYIRLHQVSYTSGVSYAFSVYCKAAERTIVAIHPAIDGGRGMNPCVADLSNGSIVSTGAGMTFSVTDVGGGWYRLAASGTATTTAVDRAGISLRQTSGAGLQTYLGDGTSGILIWGAQLETGSSATAYQRVGSAFDVTEAGVASLSYLSFDGVDDFLLTPTITPGIDKVQTFAGVRKLSDAAAGEIVGLSTSPAGLNGTFFLRAPSQAAPNYQFRSRGTTANGSIYTNALVAAPVTNVLGGIGDISAPNEVLRVNGVAVASSTLTQGTGNYGNYPLYIGRVAGTSQPFNGNIFSLLVRFGTNLDAGTITSTETWVNGKTGAYA